MYKDSAQSPGLPQKVREMTEPERAVRSAELKGFLFLTVVMVPALAGAAIATYGLAVWIYQMFAGPPTG
jgi:nitrate reductase NapE